MRKILNFFKFLLSYSFILLFVSILSGQSSGGYNLIYDEEFNDGILTWGADDCVSHGAGDCDRMCVLNVSSTLSVP